MGQSPDARLCFGIRIPGTEEYEPDNPAAQWRESLHREDDESHEFELDAFLATRAGLEDPWKKIPHEVNYGGREAYRQWKLDNPWFEKALFEWGDTKKRLADQAPVELLSYGSYEYGGHILALKGASHWATDWSPDVVDLDSLIAKATPLAIESARRFCLGNGLPFFDEPKWWLCPSYG